MRFGSLGARRFVAGLAIPENEADGFAPAEVWA